MGGGRRCALALQGSAPSNVVGRACRPRWVPPHGFASSLAYAQTAHPDCGGGACTIYRLGGDPNNLQSEGCPKKDTPCVSAEEVERAVACSCRCNGPAGSGPFCECPRGTRCTPFVEHDPEHAASYCVSERALCCRGDLEGAPCDHVSC